MLFKTCKVSKMPCFLSGSGIALLVYFCATYLRQITVINGGQRGSQFKYINSIDSVKLKKEMKCQVFLDNETGDIYSYNGVLQLYRIKMDGMQMEIVACTML